MPSDWQPTTPDNLPWGEVVEVRLLSSEIERCSPMVLYGNSVWAKRRGSKIFTVVGSEWRRLDRGEEGNGAD